MKKTVICTQCPLGCSIEVVKDQKGYSCSGQKCPRGESYAIQEVRDPRRTLTTTVWIRNGVRSLLPVRSDKPIPKRCMRQAVVELRRVTVDAPVKKGDVIFENICGVDVSIISSCDVAEKDGS